MKPTPIITAALLLGESTFITGQNIVFDGAMTQRMWSEYFPLTNIIFEMINF